MISILLSLTCLFQFYYLPANADEDISVQIVAHRGYSAAYPENTLSAFAGAYAAGAKTIEFDVRKSKDGQLIIYHDDTLVKIIGKEEPVGAYTFEQLRQLDDGLWFSDEFAKERIPTLDETLSLLKDSDVKMMVELKDIGKDPEFASQVFEAVDKYGLRNRVIFSSFNYDYLQSIKELDPTQPIMVLASFGKTNLPVRYPAEYYGVNMKTLSPDTISAIHSAGAKVYSYTPNNKQQILSLQRMGVDGVITDFPTANIM